MAGLTEVTSKLLPLITKGAPLLGSVLGTPFFGVAVSLIAKAFGVGTQDLDGLAKKIKDDPESDLKLIQIQNDHTEMLAKLASRDYAVEVEDRINARKSSPLFKDFLRHLAYLVTLGFFISLILLFLPFNFNPGARDLLSMLIGMLASKWQTIIDFFYGASRNNNSSIKL